MSRRIRTKNQYNTRKDRREPKTLLALVSPVSPVDLLVRVQRDVELSAILRRSPTLPEATSLCANAHTVREDAPLWRERFTDHLTAYPQITAISPDAESAGSSARTAPRLKHTTRGHARDYAADHGKE